MHVTDRLLRKNKDQMIQPGPMDCFEDRRGKRLRQIETTHPCAQSLMQRLYLQALAFVWFHHNGLLFDESKTHRTSMIVKSAILHDQEHRPAVAAIMM